ncbi:hypothetical protein BCR44DRAFT_1516344 [Catenaria anguillulae PL171]|uniref:Uncharacterized protein n=1 Tax=Catenaria anguillulae PL171 TaxID=765915 RepID=A0A1Y2H996_9FUNG|nr:hypothetical protein BCR44DRAFT_1516344 [Catenaria anguillulae PL171]
MSAMNPLAVILLAAILALLPAQGTSAQTLYPRAARVYLPRLRRLLSFGGIVNRQPQDVVVSLDLSKEWPTSNPLLTPLSTTLGMSAATRAQDMIPVVARNGDSYDIMLYGGMTSDASRGPKRYMLSTKDGVTLENVRSVDLGAQEYTAMIPTMSSVAIVLDEYFKDRGAVGNAPSYIVGGRPFGNASARATATVASLNFDKPANAFPPALRQAGPNSTEYSGLVYVTPSQLMIAGGSQRAWTYDLLRMEWRDYKGMFPPQASARSKNQLVTYTAPTSGRTYVISVGTDYTGPAGLFFYTDTSTQSNFTDAGPIQGFDVVMFFHSVFMVDDQLVAVGVTTDISNAEQFEPVLVFKVSESSPGTLAITKTDKFIPSAASATQLGRKIHQLHHRPTLD